MAEPDFVACFSKAVGARLTFAIHCFRAPPTNDEVLAAWLFAEVLKAASAKTSPAFDELLRHYATREWQTLPSSLRPPIASTSREPLPPLDWEDGRTLPRFAFTIQIPDGEPLFASFSKKKNAFFECGESIDEMRWFEARPTPGRPASGLIPLLVRVHKFNDGAASWPALGFVPGKISGHPFGQGASRPTRGKTKWAIVSVREKHFRKGSTDQGGWIDQRGGFEELSAILAERKLHYVTSTSRSVEVGDGEEARVGDGGTARAGVGGTAIAGDDGEATVGDEGTAEAGHHGKATAGTKGTARVGDDGVAHAGVGGTAFAGKKGKATTGSKGTAEAGRHGEATAGMKGKATAGDHGTATVGHMGTAVAGKGGVARVGKRGEAHAGIDGRVAGGAGAKLHVRVTEERVEVVVVGDDIKPDTLYRFLPKDHPRLRRGQTPGWRKA